MQRIVSSLLLSIGTLATVSASAAEVLINSTWEEAHNKVDKKILTYYIPSREEDSKIFEMSIGHSESGKQRLYFYSNYYADNNICSYPTISSQSSTMIFNGQAVKMLRWCNRFSDVDKYYYSYTPETQKGHDYVLNLFRTATTPVQVQFEGDSIPLPVIGFTKAWNLAGGNAI